MFAHILTSPFRVAIVMAIPKAWVKPNFVRGGFRAPNPNCHQKSHDALVKTGYQNNGLKGV
jgi:hypothetical protein